MPITKRKFELGIDHETEGFMHKFCDYLSSHRDVAFNREGLSKEVGVKDIYAPIFSSALNALVNINALESRYAGTDTYYAIKNEVDKNTWEPDLSSWEP